MSGPVSDRLELDVVDDERTLREPEVNLARDLRLPHVNRDHLARIRHRVDELQILLGEMESRAKFDLLRLRSREPIRHMHALSSGKCAGRIAIDVAVQVVNDIVGVLSVRDRIRRILEHRLVRASGHIRTVEHNRLNRAALVRREGKQLGIDRVRDVLRPVVVGNCQSAESHAEIRCGEFRNASLQHSASLLHNRTLQNERNTRLEIFNIIVVGELNVSLEESDVHVVVEQDPRTHRYVIKITHRVASLDFYSLCKEHDQDEMPKHELMISTREIKIQLKAFRLS